jgi:hypothetical protein
MIAVSSSPVTRGTISGTTTGSGGVFATGGWRVDRNAHSSPKTIAARISVLIRRSDMKRMIETGGRGHDDDYPITRGCGTYSPAVY